MKYKVWKNGIEVLNTSNIKDVESLIGVNNKDWVRATGSAYDEHQSFNVNVNNIVFSVVKTLY